MTRASRAASACVARNLFGIDDMAQIGRCQIFDARRALAAAPALGLRFTVAVAASLDPVRQAERFLRHMRSASFRAGAWLALGMPERICRCRHVAALPKGVEDFVEAFQSECVAQNSERNAGFNDVTRSLRAMPALAGVARLGGPTR